jgi:BNR/Asp-box repeat protein
MVHSVAGRSRVAVIAVVLAAGLGAAVAYAAATYTPTTAVVDLTTRCSGQNAEVEQATDPADGFIYEEWMGCSGIAFARSTDGGRTFSAPVDVPGSVGSNLNAWDPTLAVGPDGTVYAAFMTAHSSQWYPVVAASFDHGQTFPQVTPLVPPDAKNWGDRPFIAVGPDGTVYLTYDYGPERASVTYLCASNGSCSFATGDLNVVLQKSTDHGKTFGGMIHVSPGFPASGGDLAPLAVEPRSGAIDLLYQGYRITDPVTYTMTPAYEYFTRSTDGGASWSTPVRVGASAGTMSLDEWWIDTSIGLDAGGNLYAAWDTQGANADGSPNDTGWLSYSTDHGQSWSAPLQATPDSAPLPHIMEVVGGAAGTAYVGVLTDADPRGYAQYLRAFSIRGGWSSGPYQVSDEFGDPDVWPGDTFGLSLLGPNDVALSWGSATPSVGNKKSDIFARSVHVALR